MAGYIAKASVDNAPLIPIGSTLFGISETPAATALKVIKPESYLGNNFTTLIDGVTVHIQFKYGNSAQSNLMLKIGNTNAKSMTNPGGSWIWPANSIISFTYDGTNWVVNDGVVPPLAGAETTYNPSSSASISGQGVNEALETLDGNITGTPDASKTFITFNQTNGIITATLAPISITKSQVSDFPTFGAAALKDIDTAFSNTTSTNLPTTAAVVNYVNSQTGDLDELMHFRGTTVTDISAQNAGRQYVIGVDVFSADAGDVLIYDHKKYFWSGSKWESLGDIYNAGTGLDNNNNTFSVKYGNTAGTAAEGNDPRLSDARTPTSHTHGNITNDGTINADTTIGDGDRLLIADASGDNIIVRSPIAFNTSINNKFLSQKGTWEPLEQYELPLAADGVRGGIQLGFTLNAEQRMYPVLLSNEKAYVNVPWTDTNTTVLQSAIPAQDNKEYNVLLKCTADTREEINEVHFLASNKVVTVNSTTGVLSVPGGINGKASEAAVADSALSIVWDNILDKPTTVAGYGISDLYIENGSITIRNVTITPVTSVNGHTGNSITLTAGDLGLASALRFQGVALNELTDGSTTASVVLTNSTTLVPTAGDVVLYADKEFVWLGSAWELLGAESSFKIIQTAVTDINASNSATTTFVQAVTQNTQGVITVTKAPLDTSGTWTGNAIKDGSGNTITTSYVRRITSTDNAIACFDGTDGVLKNSSVLITNSNIVTPGEIHFTGGTQVNPIDSILGLTGNNLNFHIGWDHATGAGAGIELHSTLISDNPGSFTINACTTGLINSITTSLVGTPGNENDGGALTWGGRRVVTATNSTAVGSSTQPVFINDSGQVVACTAYSSASVASAAACTGNAATASTWQYDRGVYVALNTENDTTTPATLNGSTENATALGIGVTGNLPVTHGGTNKASWTQFAVPYLVTSTAFDEVLPNTTATQKFFAMTGDGTDAAAPEWVALSESDIPIISIGSKTSGTLEVTRGGTGITTMTYVNSVLVANSTTANDVLQTVRSGSGAFYATDTDELPQFGVLPVPQGGTGVTSMSSLRANLNIGKLYYGVCSSSAATANKMVTCGAFELSVGAIVFVTFENTNEAIASSLTMTVNSDQVADAKPILFAYNNESPRVLPAANYLKANCTYPFYYDGTNWVCMMHYNTDTLCEGIKVYRYTAVGLLDYNDNYPILVSQTHMTSSGGIGNNNNESYTDNVLGIVNDDITKVPMVNPATGLTTLPTLKMNGLAEFYGIKGTVAVDYGLAPPANPVEGQIFFQLSDTAYELPDGGTLGQILAKASSNSRSYSWIDMSSGSLTNVTSTNYSRYYVTGPTSASNATNCDLIFDENIYVLGGVLFGAAWNDYAERRACDELKPGTCVQENDNGKLTKSNERLIAGASIISDTYGMCIGETDEAKTPIAITGRVLAYTYQPRENYHAGMAVCSAPDGTIDIMTREEIRDYPDAIIGIVSEIPTYERWGAGNVKVDNRIWIKIK